ncbi:hypothetical protein AXF42_Ash000547 [Apostasia shenzhenica]|uniref:C2H2-type domain-containing protein n=1 Tax=Apostasia shenzhenica TaxID=1088818 RepID=A0A2I0AGN7_9ASPA|nr:hypothetical protein AXF42_Ash000547 [Apostasia shenzhenica]
MDLAGIEKCVPHASSASVSSSVTAAVASAKPSALPFSSPGIIAPCVPFDSDLVLESVFNIYALLSGMHRSYFVQLFVSFLGLVMSSILALGSFTESKVNFSEFPPGVNEGQHGKYWYHEDSEAYFDDVDHYRMIRAMCRLSCSICDNNAEENRRENSNRRNRFRNIEQLKGHLYHQHKMFMCNLCLEGRKVKEGIAMLGVKRSVLREADASRALRSCCLDVFISEQKLYSRSQLRQHISTGDSEVDGSESERGGFAGHPMCEFCRNPFYGDTELYMHMSTEHYTCHICQRQHPGQYDYYRNYDDLESHFRQEHFLCENDACLAKKFVVFQTEAEMKRHNAIEHGGHMSRAKRNAALQIPISFRYRRSNEQERRRGRGHGLRPEPSGNQLIMTIQDSLESAFSEERSREFSSSRPNTEQGETSQAGVDSTSMESLAISSHPESSSSIPAQPNNHSTGPILEDFSFPPLSDFEPPPPTSRYVQVLNQGSAARLGEQSFPPLPGLKDSSKLNPKPALDGLSANTMAARINPRNKGLVKVVHSARSKPLENFELGSSTSSSSSTSLNSNPWGAASQAASKENDFAAIIPANSAWNTNNVKMKHSASAPDLTNASGSHPLPNVDEVYSANKTLVESIRSSLGMDEEKYGAFRTISAEFRNDEINTWEYLAYVEQFGLLHLVPDLARLCPDPQKQKELVEAYDANMQGKDRQKGCGNAVNSKKNARKGKGKGKAVIHLENSSAKDALADSILDQVRKLQFNRNSSEDNVEILSKDGYRTAKTNINMSSVNINVADSVSIEEPCTNQRSGGEGMKKNKKSSKFHRIRLGDGSVAAFLDQPRSDSSPERMSVDQSHKPADGLPVRGVWRNGGGQRLFHQ